MFNEGVLTYFSAHCCMSFNLFHGIRVLWFSSHPVIKNFTAFYGKETFITIFLNSVLSHENSIHIVPISLWFILITSSALPLSVQTFNLDLISSFDVLLTVHLSIFILVINQLDAKNLFTVSLFHASTCFEHHMFIIKRSKLYYTASGIITPIDGRPMHTCAVHTCARDGHL